MIKSVINRIKINRIRTRLKNLQKSVDKKFMENDKIDEVQKTSFSICKRMICNRESKLTYAPVTGTYYVENTHYYIRFCDSSVTITNGKFSYYVWLSTNMINDLIKLFDRVSQNRSNEIEKRYAENALKNLNEIYNTLEAQIYDDTKEK